MIGGPGGATNAIPALITAGIAAFAVLGYSGYQASTAKPAA